MREARLWHTQAEPLAILFVLKQSQICIDKPTKSMLQYLVVIPSRNNSCQQAYQAILLREGVEEGVIATERLKRSRCWIDKPIR